MAKLVLADLVNLQNEPTAVDTINANSALIEAALEKTLSRDGTAPNSMQSILDMNSYQVINLPPPATDLSPLRLKDLNDFIGGGTINTLPSGGTTNQSLIKNSNTSYDVKWGNPPASSLSNGTTGSGQVVLATGAVLNQPVLSSIVNLYSATSEMYLGITNAAVSDVNLRLTPRGTGAVILENATNNISLFTYSPPVSVNYVAINGSVSTGNVKVAAKGSDSIIHIEVNPKGASGYLITTNFYASNRIDTTYTYSPYVYGSTANGTQYLSLITTSGAGSSDQIWLKGGTNGGTAFAVVDANGIESFKSVKASLTDGYKLGANKVIDANSAGTGYFTTMKDYTGSQFFSAGAGGTGFDFLFFDRVESWFRASGAGAVYAKFQSNGLNIIKNTASTSTSTGSLTVTGGTGIAGDVWVGGYINATGNIDGQAIVYGRQGFGFPSGVGIGATVTQGTSKSTAVTINKLSGKITTHNAILNTMTQVTFTVNNSTVKADDIVLIAPEIHTNSGWYIFNVTPAAGSFQISIRNISSGNLGDNIPIRFIVIKATQD